MTKTILITGATDGIGLATAKKLLAQGHRVLLHGRNREKLNSVMAALPEHAGQMEGYVADLSDFDEVEKLAANVMADNRTLDVLINNAGVFKTPEATTSAGLDVRFAVNTIAPYLLTRKLLPILTPEGRVINLSSAAQARVDTDYLVGKKPSNDAMSAYAQSKLAITMWTRVLADELGDKGPAIIAVNPGSMLGSKMVQEGFGVAGGDLNIGADILTRAALSPEFTGASGQYFDNDAGAFGSPHSDALDPVKSRAVVKAIESVISGRL